MKKLFRRMLLLSAAALLIQSGCKKEEPVPGSASSFNQSMARGPHARTLSSAGAQKWMNVELQIMKTVTGISNLAMVRPFSYAGIAMYEAALPGMPSYAT